MALGMLLLPRLCSGCAEKEHETPKSQVVKALDSCGIQVLSPGVLLLISWQYLLCEVYTDLVSLGAVFNFTLLLPLGGLGLL